MKVRKELGRIPSFCLVDFKRGDISLDKVDNHHFPSTILIYNLHDRHGDNYRSLTKLFHLRFDSLRSILCKFEGSVDNLSLHL